MTETSGELVTPSDLRDLGPELRLRPAARLAWHRECDTILVYANGETLSADLAQQSLLERLCGGEVIAKPEERDARALIARLAEMGCLPNA